MSPFSWKRGLKHVGIVCGLILAAGATAAAMWARDPIRSRSW